MRVRADQIQQGDLYVYKRAHGKGHGTSPVTGVTKVKQTTPGGATIARWEIATRDLLTISVAPHSKHTVRRVRAVEAGTR